jgi:hypothetical protein
MSDKEYGDWSLTGLAERVGHLGDDLEQAEAAAATIPRLKEEIEAVKAAMMAKLHPDETPAEEDGPALTEQSIEQRFEEETQAVRAIVGDDDAGEPIPSADTNTIARNF